MSAVRSRKSSASKPAAESSDADTVARARVLDVARRQFFTLGFARCSMDLLAAELGMSKKTLYRHFRSKEELVDAILVIKAEAIRGSFEAILEIPDLPYAERIERFIKAGAMQTGEISATFLHDLRRYAPASYAKLDEFRRRFAPGIWGRLLRMGMETGEVRSDVDPNFVGSLIPIAMQSLVAPDTLERLAIQPHEMMQRFFHLILHGLLSPADRTDHENDSASR